MIKLVLAVAISLLAVEVNASEYCYDRYNGDIRKVSSELADNLARLDVLQTLLVKV